MRSHPLLKIPTIAYPAHVSDVMSVLRFTQVTKPIISSRIIRSQVKGTNDRVAFAVFMYILNIWSNKLNLSWTDALLQEETWPPPSQMTFMTVNNVKPFTKALTYTSSGIHGIWKIICTPTYDFKRICLAFSIGNWILQCCLRRNSKDFYHFLRFPHCRILTSFMGYLGTSNVANFHAQRLNELNISATTLILLFNNNAHSQAYPFILSLLKLVNHQFSMMNLTQ